MKGTFVPADSIVRVDLIEKVPARYRRVEPGHGSTRIEAIGLRPTSGQIKANVSEFDYESTLHAFDVPLLIFSTIRLGKVRAHETDNGRII